MNRLNKNTNLKKLIISYLRGDISEEDSDALEQWIAENAKNKEFIAKITDEEHISESLSELSFYNTQSAWNNISGDIKPRKRKIFNTLLRIVAILVIMFGSWGIMKYVMDDMADRTQLYEKKLSDIVPGQAKALLILPDGKEIKLEEVKDTSLLTTEGEVLINSDRSIKYCQSKGEVKGNVADLRWHTIKIPRGGEYVLNLSDGTKVWLNSDSEIKYPSEFSGKIRQVYLKGEGYFDVEKNPKKPFIVNTSRMSIKVLGTGFNVMAYEDEDNMHTTLVEGLVEIKTKGANAKVQNIYPGQQALLKKGGLQVKKVKTKLYTAWKEGRFAFNSEPLESVVRKLSRWYNVEFFFVNNSLKERKFTGSIPKYQDISKVVEMLEYTSKARFSMKNNAIVVREK